MNIWGNHFPIIIQLMLTIKRYFTWSIYFRLKGNEHLSKALLHNYPVSDNSKKLLHLSHLLKTQRWMNSSINHFPIIIQPIITTVKKMLQTKIKLIVLVLTAAVLKGFKNINCFLWLTLRKKKLCLFFF